MMRHRSVLTLALAAAVAPAALAPLRLAGQEMHVAPAPPRPAAGWLGFAYTARAERRELGTPGTPAAENLVVFVSQVLKGSPADRAGMEPGDTIVRVNGEAASLGRISAAARRLNPGDTVRVEVRRAGREQRLTLVAARRPDYLPEFAYSGGMLPRAAGFGTMFRVDGDSIRRTMRIFLDSARLNLDSMPFPRSIIRHDSLVIIEFGNGRRPDTVHLPNRDSMHARTLRQFRRADSLFAQLPRVRVWTGEEMGLPGMDVEVIGRRAIAGAALQELTPQLAEYFGVREGLLVESVAKGTPAGRAGLQAGDVVTSVDARPVGDIADLRRALSGRQGTVKMDVLRKGKKHQLELKWP